VKRWCSPIVLRALMDINYQCLRCMAVSQTAGMFRVQATTGVSIPRPPHKLNGGTVTDCDFGPVSRRFVRDRPRQTRWEVQSAIGIDLRGQAHH
jgi:hypothetical protein